jgi:hypothetical protein
VFTKLENKIIHKLFDYNLGKLIKEIDSPQNILFSKLKHGYIIQLTLIVSNSVESNFYLNPKLRYIYNLTPVESNSDESKFR